MAVFISGVHSGPNPSPGVGTARSLRDAFPEMELIAVDYSRKSSGLHSPVFDDVLLFRPWNELDLKTHASQIEERLRDENYWISGLDLEVGWLAQHLGNQPHILSPNRREFRATRKPDIPAADDLPVAIPSAINAYGLDTEIEEFCRQHDWEVWVKAPSYDAIPAPSWRDLTVARTTLADIWSTRDVVIQSHVEGDEVSIAFAASDGNLLDAVFMEKHVLTESGKTWAGSINPVPAWMQEPLSKTVKNLSWTGGCELEFVRSDDGQFQLIDWNPRFPAWIHGATLSGTNLPALLIETVTGLESNTSTPQSNQFTRIVSEYPVKDTHPLPLESTSQTESVFFETSDKHPSGMPLLAQRQADPTHHIGNPQTAPEWVRASLNDLDLSAVQTPIRVPMDRAMETAFTAAADAVQRAASQSDLLQIAYSVKTNPKRRLLETAIQHDFYAEVITGDELTWAMDVGFKPRHIIVNGPVGVHDLLDIDVEPVAAVFADSLPALNRLTSATRPPAEIVGIRIQPPNEPSRFGVPLKDPEAFAEVVIHLESLPDHVPVGLHLHIQSSRVGVKRWLELGQGLVNWATILNERVENPVIALDLGGGWTPHDFQERIPEHLPSLLAHASDQLPALETVFLEPGKALARPSAAIISTVVEHRQLGSGPHDIVLDTARSELPLAGNRSYPVFLHDGDEWQQLESGEHRLLGRICMEKDILVDGIDIPDTVSPGDTVAFLSTGGYDDSMSYEFGKGGAPTE